MDWTNTKKKLVVDTVLQCCTTQQRVESKLKVSVGGVHENRPHENHAVSKKHSINLNGSLCGFIL